jgi:hypothetical protein
VEVDAVGVVDEVVQDGVGIGGVTDDGVPIFHRQLAGDDGGSPAIAFFKYVQEIVADCRDRRLGCGSSVATKLQRSSHFG